MKRNTRYENGTPFKFISNIGEKLGEKLVLLNEIVFGVIEAKPYKLDWAHILKEYYSYKDRHGNVDIDSFSYDYVLGHSLVNDFAKDQVMKEAMYLHLKAELRARVINNEMK